MESQEFLDQSSGSAVVKEISDFHLCFIVEVPEENSAECFECRKEENKSVLTSFMCQPCGLYYCFDCYDTHRRETFISTLQTFKQEASSNVLKFSNCGKYISFDSSTSCSEVNDETPIANSSNCKCSSQYNSKIDSASQIAPPCMLRTLEETLPVVTILQEYGVYPQIEFDEGNKFKFMYIQDPYMKDFFNFFPHRICLDMVGRLPNIDCALYFFISEDSNGHHEVISFALDAVEDKESLKWILDTFKKHNPSWRKIQLLVVDTLIKNQEIVQNCFPDTKVLACYYHTNRMFMKFFVEKGKNSIFSFQKNFILQNIKTISLACSTTEYNELCDRMQAMHRKIANVFQKLWNDSGNVWEVRMDDAENFFSNLNEYLSFIELKFKPILCVESDLCTFIRKFFFILKLLRTVHKNNVARLCGNSKPSPYSRFTPQFLIFSLITAYSAKIVIQQLEKSEEINLNPEHLTQEMLNGTFSFDHLGKVVHTSLLSCSCNFSLLSLPCCHIFAVRKALSCPVFDISLFGSQWKEEYYTYTYDCLRSTSFEQLQSEKDCNAASELLDSIIPNIEGCSLQVVNDRFSSLMELVSAWKNSRIVDLHFDGEKADSASLLLLNSLEVTTADKSENINSGTVLANKQEKSLQAVSSTVPKQPGDWSAENEWEFGKHLFKQTINFVYLNYVICKTKDSCVSWLQHMNFLPSSMACPSCGSNMIKKYVNRMLDGVIWICKKTKGAKKNCAKRCTVRRGTWFEATNMELYQILPLCYMWVYDYNPAQIVFELAISNATYAAWDKIFAQVCLSSVENSSENELSFDSIKSKWLDKNAGKDVFISFLQDSAASHQCEIIVI